MGRVRPEMSFFRSAGIAASGETWPLSEHVPRTTPDDLGTMNHTGNPSSFLLAQVSSDTELVTEEKVKGTP